MLCTTLVALAFVAPPRFDAEGEPLPAEAVQRLGSLRFLVNHLAGAAFSPDGKVVYTVSGWDESGLIAWEVPSGKKLWQSGAGCSLERVAADPDGKGVWAVERVRGKDEGDRDQFRRVRYAAADGKELARSAAVDCYATPALHPSGAMADINAILDREGKSADLPSLTQAKGEYSGTVRWSPAADRLFVSSTKDGAEVRLAAVDVATRKELWSVQTDPIGEWCVAPDGKWVVAVTERKDSFTYARKLDAKTGQELGSFTLHDFGAFFFGSPDLGGRVHIHPDGKTAYVTDREDRTTAIDVAKWETVDSKVKVPAHAVFSPDGRLTAAPFGRHVGVWETKTGKRLGPGQASFSPPHHLTQLRFTHAYDRVTRLDNRFTGAGVEWDVLTGRETGRTAGKDLDTSREEDRTVVSANGKTKAVLGEDDDGWRIRITRLDSPKDPPVVLKGGWGGGGTPYEWMSFTPDAHHFLAADPRAGLHIWDTKAGGKPVEVKFGRDDTYESMPSDGMQISPSGRMVAVVERGGPVAQLVPTSDKWPWQIGVYEIPSGKLVHQFEGKGELAAYRWVDDWVAALVKFPPVSTPFGPLLTPRDGKSKLVSMDPTTKAMRAHAIDVDVQAWAAAPFGDTVAVGSGDGLRLYEASTGKLRYTFREQTRPVEVLAFSPNGRHLAAESADGPLLVWDVRGDLNRPAKPDAAGWDAAWKALGESGAEAAFRAVRLFAVFPEGAAELARRFAADKPPGEEAIAALVRKLGDREFKTREQAEKELRALGATAFPALTKAVADSPSAELAERANKLLAVTAPADQLRAERAVEALRLADTGEARKVLAEWAKGEAKSPLTAAARRK